MPSLSLLDTKADDAEAPQGGRREEPGPQRGDNYRSGAHEHPEEILPGYSGEEFLVSV